MKTTTLISILSLIILSGCDNKPSNKMSEDEVAVIQQQIAKMPPKQKQEVKKAKIINFKPVGGGENEKE